MIGTPKKNDPRLPDRPGHASVWPCRCPSCDTLTREMVQGYFSAQAATIEEAKVRAELEAEARPKRRNLSRILVLDKPQT